MAFRFQFLKTRQYLVSHYRQLLADDTRVSSLGLLYSVAAASIRFQIGGSWIRVKKFRFVQTKIETFSQIFNFFSLFDAKISDDLFSH